MTTSVIMPALLRKQVEALAKAQRRSISSQLVLLIQLGLQNLPQKTA